MSMHPIINYFKEYKGDCDVFIETGTYLGGGVTLAIQADFTEIYTIDLKDHKDPNYKHGLKVNYLFGDSADVLKELLPKLKGKKIMFWLDAHSMLTEGEKPNYPLILELRIILDSGITNATILIDDYLYMTHPLVTSWTHKQIEKIIKDINKDYRIEYLPNPIINNILLARI